MLHGKLNDLVTLVKADGTVAKEDIKALVQPKMIFMDDETLPIEPGDHLLHKLPSGLVADYLVDDPGFYSKSFTGMGAHFQTKVRRDGPGFQREGTIINNIQGDNARVNMHSVDNSSNYVMKAEGSAVLERLRELLAASEIPDAETQKIHRSIEAMETSQTKEEFLKGYQNFMNHAATHVTVFAPLLGALAQLLPS